MKPLRLWLVVLLAVLLPLRGAMAATMLCAPAVAAHAEMRAMDHGPDHAHEGAAHGHALQAHEHAASDHPDGAHDSATHDSATHDKCTLCASSCSSTPLPAASAGMPAPVTQASAPFPALAAPAPTFESDGPERPPRTR